MPTSGTQPSNVKAQRPAVEPIAMRVPEACRYLGIGRSTLYVLISEGEIEFIKLGSATLVLTESLKELVERKRDPLKLTSAIGAT